jgi:hypothetical protein
MLAQRLSTHSLVFSFDFPIRQMSLGKEDHASRDDDHMTTNGHRSIDSKDVGHSCRAATTAISRSTPG